MDPTSVVVDLVKDGLTIESSQPTDKLGTGSYQYDYKPTAAGEYVVVGIATGAVELTEDSPTIIVEDTAGS